MHISPLLFGAQLVAPPVRISCPDTVNGGDIVLNKATFAFDQSEADTHLLNTLIAGWNQPPNDSKIPGYREIELTSENMNVRKKMAIGFKTRFSVLSRHLRTDAALAAARELLKLIPDIPENSQIIQEFHMGMEYPAILAAEKAGKTSPDSAK